jgi:hypothetical protein
MEISTAHATDNSLGNVYLIAAKVITNLHESGFTNDFQLSGHSLFWVQEQILINWKEVEIIERHKIGDPSQGTPFIVFGIVAPSYHVKGILIDHGDCDADKHIECQFETSTSGWIIYRPPNFLTKY